MSTEPTYISNIELAGLIKTDSVVVIDVRSLAEFEEGHIRNTLHRPVDTLPTSVTDIPKERIIVTVCNNGVGRSERAASLLQVAGWKNARSLIGGYLGWIEAGLPDYEPGFTSS